MAMIGIDLGTTNSLATVWRNGKSELIPNAAGEYLTPSVVSVDEDGSILVGQAAKERLVSHPDQTAACFKRYMGTAKVFHLGEHKFKPEDLSALILRRLREDAECYLGEPVTEAVISVPAYFADAQRSATKRAGALAGLKVDRLINEPSAAAMSAHISEGDEDKVCLVFDLGGGTLDVSLVERFDNVVSVTAVSGDNHLGGTDFDQYIAEGFCKETGLSFKDLNPQQQETILHQAEICKMALTTQDLVLMVVDDGEINASLPLTNEWLIRKCSPLFRRMVAPVRTVFRDAEMSIHDLDELVMVGGSSHMPSVQRYIAEILGLNPVENSRPDTAIALGVGICAGMKARVEDVKELVLTDVCPFTLGVAAYNRSEPKRHIMSPIIERNSVLPTSKENIYYTVTSGQSEIDVQIYQGENPYVEDNTLLEKFSVSVVPAPAGEQFVKIRFTYDINGLLEVEVINKEGDVVRKVLRSGEMTEQAAEQRLKELAALKMHPRELEVPRAMIARAERLYTMTVGALREEVGRMLIWYQGRLETQEMLTVAKATQKMDQFLDQVELYVGKDIFPDFDFGEEEEDEL